MSTTVTKTELNITNVMTALEEMHKIALEAGWELEIMDKVKSIIDSKESILISKSSPFNINPKLAKVIADLLVYSFDDIEFDYNKLTEHEKNIVGSHETMDDLTRFINKSRV